MNETACNFCGKKDWHDRAGYGFQVSECHECGVLVCENCAETDYDLQGDPGRYVCTQWKCPDKNCGEEAA